MKLKLSTESILLFGVILFLFLLFLFRIDFTALQSYDEAWYGTIARNLAHAKNPFELEFNGKPFSDHPPLGFVLMSIATAVLGSSELSVRLVSACMGVGTLLFVYLIGRKMGGKMVGVTAAAILISSMWFMLRVRSGNLDIPFLFWEVATVYFLLSKRKYSLCAATVCFAALILTKTLVGVGLLPVFFLLLWHQREEVKRSTLAMMCGIWLFCVAPWYVSNQIQNTHFLYHHFFEVGSRSTNNSFSIDAIQRSSAYVAIGVGKWFKPFLVSILISSVLVVKRKTMRFNFLVLLVWFLGFSVFLFSSKTEVWHLLPLYPIIALVIPLALLTASKVYLPTFTWIRPALLIGIMCLALFQFIQFSNLLYFAAPVASAEKDIAIKASSYSRLHLLDTFFPAVVFYSQSIVDPLYWQENGYEAMVQMLENGSGDTFIINRQTKQQLENDAVQFTIREQNESYYVVQS